MKRRIASLWQTFRHEVIALDAPAVQILEMRRAFYAGVECALNRLSQEMSPGPSTDNTSDFDILQEVNAELQEFASHVKTGRA